MYICKYLYFTVSNKYCLYQQGYGAIHCNMVPTRCPQPPLIPNSSSARAVASGAPLLSMMEL